MPQISRFSVLSQYLCTASERRKRLLPTFADSLMQLVKRFFDKLRDGQARPLRPHDAPASNHARSGANHAAPPQILPQANHVQRIGRDGHAKIPYGMGRVRPLSPVLPPARPSGTPLRPGLPRCPGIHRGFPAAARQTDRPRPGIVWHQAFRSEMPRKPRRWDR